MSRDNGRSIVRGYYSCSHNYLAHNVERAAHQGAYHPVCPDAGCETPGAEAQQREGKARGEDGALLLRLRGLGRIARRKLEALALDTGIAPQEVDSTVLRLKATGLISAQRRRGNRDGAHRTAR